MKIKLRSRFSCMFILAICLVSTFAYSVTLVDSDFSSGSFSSTYYNSSLNGLVLDGLSGSYSSVVYDSLSYASWNFNYSIADGSVLVLVDKKEDIWKSVDFGRTWVAVNTDFSGDNDDAIDLLFFDNVLYLIDKNEDIFSSSDYGHTWNLVNDDFNGGEGGNGKVAGVDSFNFYIFDGDEDVWRSNDSAVSFVEINSDFTSSEIKGFAYDGSFIYVVDNGAEFWKSSDNGFSWISVNSDYNLGSGDSADDLTYYSGNFYILDGQDVWRSNDSGISFVKVSDDFNVGDDNDGKTIVANSDGLYVIDGSEDVYVSYDLGVSFNLLASDMNSGGNDIISIVSYDVGSYSLDYNLDSSRYFSYSVNFSSLDTDYSPILHNVTVIYDVLNSAPNFSVGFDSGLYSGNVSLNVSVWDYDGNSSYVSFYEGDSLLNYSYVLNGTIAAFVWDVTEGNHSWYAIVNDSDFVSTSVFNFSVDSSVPYIDLNVSSLNASFGEIVNVSYSVSDLNLDSVYFNISLEGLDVLVSNLSSLSLSFNLSGNYTVSVFANDSLGHGILIDDLFVIRSETVTNETVEESSSVNSVSTGSGGGRRNIDDSLSLVLNDSFSPNVLVGESLESFDFNSDLDEDSVSGIDFSLDGVDTFEPNSELDQDTVFNRFTGAAVYIIGTNEAKYVLLMFGLIFVFSVGYHYGVHHKEHISRNSKKSRKSTNKKRRKTK